MRQKILFEKDIKKNMLKLVELSEVDPGVIIELFEDTYDLEAVTQASSEGYQRFMFKLRRKGFFPTADFSAKLFENTVEYFKDPNARKITIEYDDMEAFPDAEEFLIEEDDVELDSLLEDDGDTKEDEIKEIDSEDDTPKFKPEDTSEHEN